jgi:DNA-directed RNA polymerase specialized sigma24 family protein
MPAELAPVLDFPGCLWAVQQYLLGQNWQLVEPQRLAQEIWRALEQPGPVAGLSGALIQQQVVQRYGEHLHQALRSDEGVLTERAWEELSRWLQRQVGKLTVEARAGEEVVQSALEILHYRLRQGPLNAPAALWAYALQTLRSVCVDHHRRRTALKRGSGMELRLEAVLQAMDEPAVAASWPYHAEAVMIEEAVIDNEVRLQLRAFFRRHFTSQLQCQVAEMFFIEGLSPQEIGALLGKPPHEVRLVKARVVRSLRNLPPPASQALSAIINTP